MPSTIAARGMEGFSGDAAAPDHGCCCGTADGSCCGMICCATYAPSKESKPEREEDEQSRARSIILVGLSPPYGASATKLLGGHARSEIAASFPSTLQALCVRLDA